ncbi:aldo/keto reductase [Mucilaginibacter daejeonensis]|uniref:aldo/keto reductase n=1 Tax=Mucilaginibacter daejeonensis TaxID=398049 RepID=UPI001D176A89|nr:aldo/keto reductase [Mucilaginibacter daejeonensis]UEG55223.1 aldo/keto reductase [Mucilaginibacter daejeonensis]
MENRKIGRSDLSIAPLVFGGNVFGWTIDERTSFTLLDAFVDHGLNCIDTADVYSRWAPGNQGGESETIIGNWLKKSGKRNDVIIATKVGSSMTANDSKKNLSKAYILKGVEDSLRRLQTDHIDLYQSHYDDKDTAVQEMLEAYNQLIKDGKVRYIGASNFSPERLKESLETGERSGLPSYVSLQPEYNLYDREGYEEELEALCKKYGLGVITYYSLASGFLSGKYRSENDLNKSKRGQGIKKYLNDRGQRILMALDDSSKEHNASPAAISLAWVMARPTVTAPIASATSVEQLKELARSVEIKLSAEDVAKLDEASAY